jgi:photosystem II stability/assembly factor-like uncharacterized protein
MRNRRTLIAALVVTLTAGCTPVRNVPLAGMREGGRALSIAVASTDAKRLIVATESGGLFRTADGGATWRHLDRLGNYKTRDVAIASLDPNVVIATAEAQYRTVNDGGIWRSADGGNTWSQPPGSAPPPGPDCPARSGAFGISHMPGTHTFFVGTDCGIAVSEDDGATWSHFVLDPAAAGTGRLPHRVVSLLVLSRTAGVASSERGLFFLAPSGVWTKGQDVVPGHGPLHAFAAPFWNGSSLFYQASSDRKLFVSTNGGANWSQIADAPQEEVALREAFVRVSLSLSGDDDLFDLYWGNGVHPHRRSFRFGAPPTSAGPWQRLSSDHVDPSDVAFGLGDPVPILLASDGGVHLTTDEGRNWKLTGTGGYNALQVSDMTGQAVAGSQPHLDLYFGTMDNGFHGSSDGGRTWKHEVSGEGRFLSVEPTSTGHAETLVTFNRCGLKPDGHCEVSRTGAHFADLRSWPDAPQGVPRTGLDAPSRIVGDAYLQFAQSAKPPFEAFETLSAGGAWSRAFSLSFAPVGPAVFAGSPFNLTIYQGVTLLGDLPDGSDAFNLFRVRSLAGQAVVKQVNLVGIGNLGSVRTPQSRRVVFGVDPKDADHLIAADITSKAMKLSADGGDSWFPLPQLTKAVTGDGRFLFTILDRSLATVIAWDPFDSCHILIGTMQNGVLRSSDGGNTWSRILGSEQITSVSSFFFPPTGPIWVSTSGRGLWTLGVGRRAAPGTCRFPQPGPFPDGGTIGAIQDAVPRTR